MVRASGRGEDGRRFIILGLEPGNIERLKNDQPIMIDAAELGFDGDIIIVYGDAMVLATQLAPHGMQIQDRRGKRRRA